MAKPFYEKSNIVNFESNVLYDDLVKMSFDELDKWIDRLREEIMEQWDDPDSPTPPTIGKNEEDMIKAFSQLRSYDVDDFYIDCLLYTSQSPRDRTRSRMPSSA